MNKNHPPTPSLKRKGSYICKFPLFIEEGVRG